MKDSVDRIVNELKTNSKVKKIDVHAFDSGAFMIDVWVRKEFYCIQLSDGNFGLSKVEDDNGFSTIPDEIYPSYEEFIVNLLHVVNSSPKAASNKNRTSKKRKDNIWQKISNWRIWDWWDI
jgi:hypothetical protein